ncbi:MAG: uracil phosphoribosyltransferase / pyrimidine operon regulatory protein, partial [Deltaproteobacteria bacterium]|nr:uracil phosphoribosyltransferase / pyrimidine operon regulatory protein [Deltaproteobacteria bacterium]
MSKKRVVMDSEGIERSLTRISYEILEKNKGVEDLVIIGIQKGGVVLAERICGKISRIEDAKVPMGKLDITLYRDDLSS